MSEVKHTPGPWTVDVHKNVMAAGGMVAFPCISAGFDQDANGRLIAAAPDLLEALQALVEHGTDSPEHLAAERAIARATGTAS